MYLFLFLAYIFIFSGLIYYWKFFDIKGVRKKYLIAVFVLKIIAGFGLAQLYTDHYTNRRTGDAFRFYDDAAIMYSSIDESPMVFFRLISGIGMKTDSVAQSYYMRMTHLERDYYNGFLNDNATIIRVNAIVMLFSLGYYHIHTVFWCFFAMIGLTAIFKLCVNHFPRKKWAMFFAVYLLPTVLFWSSGVLKEPMFLLGLGIFLLGFFRFIYSEHSRSDYFKIIFGFLILLVAKGYVIQCLAPALVGLLLAKAFSGRRFWLWFSLPHLLIIPLLFIGPYISDGLKISELMHLKQTAFYNVAYQSNSGSIIALRPINGPADIILNAPAAMVNTYLRPWPWQWEKLLYIPAALENLLLLFVLGIMIWNFRRPYGLSIPILAFCGSFVLVLGVLSGEVVPVLGALVRYKLPSLIFLFVLIFALTDHVKLQRRFPIIRRMVRRL
ncbi:hypothetical protein G3O08_04490 [Cryomorpha ignava]|uniref:Glycosyltransferase RgtA/B/C/D-like domain-containing protein n=1 Tax=Cryomorpha ignava TaxID=101383 RepID=A0A7K3WMK5_9FLAO|nr:hypothetical protein [Cryomorpha ignava]NEN22758.1 hypothetical protein [Cryomorpha ignava]